jgi:hypothetical protein
MYHFVHECNIWLLSQSLNRLYIPTITNHTQVWWVPNVVVAHEKEGIEAIHLAAGRTICKVQDAS